MDVSQFVAGYLVRRGVRRVLGMLGRGNLRLGQAIKDSGPRLKFVPVRHEQNAAHAAAAYARFSGRAAVVTVSHGPGAANLAAALAEAKISRLPMLVLAGETALNGRPPMLQQLESPDGNAPGAAECLKTFSCYWARLEHPDMIGGLLDSAFEAMYRPGLEGPAVLAVPLDLWGERCARPRGAARAAGPGRPAKPEPRLLRGAAELIRGARRPLIIAGGGVIRSGAWRELEHLCAAALCPAVHTQSGNGALLYDDPLNLFGVGVQGAACANSAASRADLILLAGTRLTDFTTGSGTLFRGGADFISLNVSAMDNAKINGLRLTGDAREILGRLAGLLSRGARSPERKAWLREIAASRAAWLSAVGSALEPRKGVLTQPQLINSLSRKAGREALVITSTGSLSGDLFRFWPCRSRDRKGYYVPFGFSCMGAEVAGALGARLAQPRRRIYAFAGDSSFLLGHQELATMLQQKLEAVIIVSDNGGAQSINRQQRGLGLDEFGNELRYRPGGKLSGAPLPLDYAGMAEGHGAAVFRVSDLKGFEKALTLAEKVSGRPSVICAATSPAAAPLHGGWSFDMVPARPAPRLERAPARGELEQMVRKAGEAQRVWAGTPLNRRALVLKKAAGELERLARRAAAIIAGETGKPVPEAERDCERARQALLFFAEKGADWLVPERCGAAGGLEVTLVFEPRGVVGAITPSDFPLDLPVWSAVAPALMAGNAVILKPGAASPRSAGLLNGLFSAAGLPRGVFQVLQGGDLAGKALAGSGVDMISFTGSAVSGREIAGRCAAAGKHFSLETGGKNAAVVTEDCDLEAAAELILRGALLNAGQGSGAIKRVLAHKKIFARLAGKLAGGINAQPPLRMADPAGVREALAQAAQALIEGCALLAGEMPSKLDDTALLKPLLLFCPDTARDIWLEETSGPVVLISGFSTDGKALEKLNTARYGLAVSICTKKRERFLKLAAGCDAGMVFWNRGPRPVFEGVWTGRRQSGGGHLLGRRGVRNFTLVKQLVLPRARHARRS